MGRLFPALIFLMAAPNNFTKPGIAYATSQGAPLASIGVPLMGALKNAIGFLSGEWTDKAARFIGWGYTMGARAIEHLRLVMASVQVATVCPQVGLSLFADFESATIFKPGAMQEKNVNAMLDHVIACSGALRSLRGNQGNK